MQEFKLKPFYSTGSVRGGCVGDYLWNVGECQEILSVFDPVATKAHIRQFLETGVKLRNQLFDVAVDGDNYTVSCQGKTLKAKIGHVVTIAGGELTLHILTSGYLHKGKTD